MGALGNILGGVQLAAGTTLFMMGPQVLHLVAGAWAVVGVAASGFGFALVMGISGLLEVREVVKGKARQRELRKDEKHGDDETIDNTGEMSAEKQVRKDSISSEAGAVAEHRQSAKMWGWCFLGMGTLAVGAQLPFPPVVMIGAAVVSVCIAGYRWYLAQHHTTRGENSLGAKRTFSIKAKLASSLDQNKARVLCGSQVRDEPPDGLAVDSSALEILP